MADRMPWKVRGTMSEKQIINKIALAKEAAAAGVDFSPRFGAVCPWCNAIRLPVYRTMPWIGKMRVRYHRCNNKECVLNILTITVKSLEEDMTNVLENC